MAYQDYGGYTSGLAIADTLENTLLNYVMQNRKMQEQSRQFDVSMGEERRQFDLGEARSMRAEDLMGQMRKGDKQMFQQAASFRKQRGFQKDYDRSKREFIEAKEANPLNWLNPFSDESDYAKEFQELTGPRPEPKMAGLPQGDFLPRYGTQEYLRSLEYDPNSLLQMLMMQGLGTGGY